MNACVPFIGRAFGIKCIRGNRVNRKPTNMFRCVCDALPVLNSIQTLVFFCSFEFIVNGKWHKGA